MKNKQKIIFIVVIVLITLLKLLMVYDVPVCMNAALNADDALMIRMTRNILKGRWLGEYDGTNFQKGVMFPLLLCIIYNLPISYTNAITIIYILACLCMTFVLSKRVKSKVALSLIYLCLVFNPIMMSTNILCRVYRNSVIPAYTLFIVARIYKPISKEKRRKNKKQNFMYCFT